MLDVVLHIGRARRLIRQATRDDIASKWLPTAQRRLLYSANERRQKYMRRKCVRTQGVPKKRLPPYNWKHFCLGIGQPRRILTACRLVRKILFLQRLRLFLTQNFPSQLRYFLNSRMPNFIHSLFFFLIYVNMLVCVGGLLTHSDET